LLRWSYSSRDVHAVLRFNRNQVIEENRSNREKRNRKKPAISTKTSTGWFWLKSPVSSGKTGMGKNTFWTGTARKFSGSVWTGELGAHPYIRPPGWTRLPSIRRITDILQRNQIIDEIEFESVFYKHPNYNVRANYPNIDSALNDFIGQESKPTISVIFSGQAVGRQIPVGHAVTLIKEENNEFVFKNSYGQNNPNNPEYIRIPKSRPPGVSRNDFEIFFNVRNLKRKQKTF